MTRSLRLGLLLTLAPVSALAQSEPGERIFQQQCRACHQVGGQARNALGPHLNGLFERPAGSVGGFNYSPAYRQPPIAGRPWTIENFTSFVRNPRQATPGTRMVYPGLSDHSRINELVDYLRGFDPSGNRAP